MELEHNFNKFDCNIVPTSRIVNIIDNMSIIMPACMQFYNIITASCRYSSVYTVFWSEI